MSFRLLAMLVLAVLPGLLDAQTNLVFQDMQFGDTTFIKSATRTAQDSMAVSVTFQDGAIPVTRLPRAGIAFAAPVVPSDPCGAIVEMFTASVHHRDDGRFSRRGVPTYPPAGERFHGFFLHPTVFVGTTNLSIAGGAGPGAGGGKWDFFTTLANGRTSPVSQDLDLLDIGVLGVRPSFHVEPPGTPPYNDGPGNISVRVFGGFSEFLLYEDCPSTSTWFDGEQVATNGGNRVEVRLDDTVTIIWHFDALFYVRCSGKAEPMLQLHWALLDQLQIKENSFFTLESVMGGSLTDWSARPAEPARTNTEVDLIYRDWVVR